MRSASFYIPKSLNPYKKIIEKTTKQCAKLQYFESNDTTILSKLGGLPTAESYPSFPMDLNKNRMLLLAQINFSEFQLEKPFPKSGILQFFVNEQFGNNHFPQNWEQHFVKLINSPNPSLITTESFAYNKNNDDFPIKNELKLIGHTQLDPLSSLDYRYDLFFGQENHKIVTADNRTFEEIYFETYLGADTKIGGYPYFIGNDFRANNPSLQKYDTLLLQIVTDDQHGINYRDSGIISFFIAGDKLESLDFSDVYCHTESY